MNHLKYPFLQILIICNLPVLAQPQTLEPKSTHTWLDTEHDKIYAYDIDLRVTDFPEHPDKGWLYYFAIQVNFTDHDEWSHGGIQYANAEEFVDNNNLGVNWGGGSDWAGYGGIGRTNTPFTWQKNTWYRFRVWKLDKKDDLYNWAFYVLNYDSGEELFAGTVVTKSEYIKNAVVWMETGYGVVCDTDKARIEWRNPVYRTVEATGEFPAIGGTSSYNGTCEGELNTNQGVVGKSPLIWFQETKAKRSTPPKTKIF